MRSSRATLDRLLKMRRALKEIGDYAASRSPDHSEADLPRVIKEIRRTEASRRGGAFPVIVVRA